MAPNARSWATFAGGAWAGTKMIASSPASAQKPASDEAALPVDEQAIVLKPSSRAFVVPTAEARSLNEQVGRRPSSLSQSVATPAFAARRVAFTIGVPPTWSCGSPASPVIGRRSR